jgi:hypothetical protein
MACWEGEERRRGYIDALGEARKATQGILQPIFRNCSAPCFTNNPRPWALGVKCAKLACVTCLRYFMMMGRAIE